MPKGDDSTPVVLLRGEYPDPRPDTRVDGRPETHDYFIALEHRKKVQGKNWPITLLCSAGWDKAHPKDCVPCHEAQAGDTSIDGGKVPRTKFLLNLVHLVDYHLIPDVDRDTRQVRKDDSGKPYMVKSPCEGRGCEHCRNESQSMFGAKKYLDIGSNHLEDLQTIAADIGRVCLNCRDGIVKTASFECPDCGNVIIDCTHQEYTEDEVDNFATTALTCSSCRVTNIPIETMDCTKCQDPMATSIFDVVLHIRRTGEKTNSHLGLHSPNPQELAWCFLDQFYIEDGRPLVTEWTVNDAGVWIPTWDDEVKKMSAPYDFSKMTGIGAAASLDAQAKRMQVNNPFVQQKSREYGDGPSSARM